jgi:hypothetical protein
MTEKQIIDMFRQGHSIKYILKKAKHIEKLNFGYCSEKELLKWIEDAILKYWNSLK